MPLPRQLIDDARVQRAYAQALQTYGEPAHIEAVLRDAQLEALDWAVGGQGQLARRLADNQALMRSAISPVAPLRAWQLTDADALHLELEVVEPFPIEVLGLEFGEQGFVALKREWFATSEGAEELVAEDSIVLRARLTEVPDIVTVRVPWVELPVLASDGTLDLQIVTRLWGLEERIPFQVATRSPYTIEGTP
jgi:hypothetical protein